MPSTSHPRRHVPPRVYRLGVVALVAALHATPSAAAPPAASILLVDDAAGADADHRTRVMKALAAALRRGPRSLKVTVHRRPAPPAVDDTDRITPLLTRARIHSEQFEEKEARRTLDAAERTFRKSFGPRVEIAPLVAVYLARARLHADLDQRDDLEEDLSRVIALDPRRSLDTGTFTPRVIRTYDKLRSRLRKRTGTISVNTRPAGLPVRVDGALRGAAPLTLKLITGEHFVAAGRPGATAGRPVLIRLDAAREITIEAARPPRLDDAALKALGREAGVTWVASVILRPRGPRHQVRLRTLAARGRDLPRGLRSAPLEARRLPGACAALASRLVDQLRPRPGPPAVEPGPSHVASPAGAKSVFKTWWFWTLVGVVVGGSTATAVVLTRDSDPGVRVTLTR